MKSLGREVGTLVKHSGIFGVGMVLSKAVGFIMIPVYTRYLKPADYGVLELLDLVIFFVTLFAASGIHTAMFRFYSAYENPEEKKQVVATAAIYYCVTSFTLSLLLTIFAGPVAETILGSRNYTELVRVTAWTLFFTNLCEVPFGYWRAQKKSMEFVMAGLVRTALGAGSLVIALVVLQKGVLGAVYAGFFANLIAGVFLTLNMFRKLPLRTSVGKLKEMLKFGAPMVLWSLGSFVVTFSDRFFLRQFGNLADVGIYSLAYKFGQMLPLLVGAPFALIWQARVYELAKQDDAKEVYAKISAYLVFVSLYVSLGVAIFSKEVLAWLVPKEYWSARMLIPFILLSYTFVQFQTIALSGVMIKKRTKPLAIIAMIIATVNLGFNYLLIQPLHQTGAAMATLFTYVIWAGMALYLAQRVYHVPYEFGRMFAMLLTTGAIFGASLLNHGTGPLNVLVDVLLCLLALAILLRILSQEERAMFGEVFRQGVIYIQGMFRRPPGRVTPASNPEGV